MLLRQLILLAIVRADLLVASVVANFRKRAKPVIGFTSPLALCRTITSYRLYVLLSHTCHAPVAHTLTPFNPDT
ncbi:hypothetical protein GCM10025778_15520 [Paeniglutamicibacter antarcticus]|uniref:Secreted protein n=1 Tax=Paeniglutamicibacter antarcticus TaxID=494023 RepID=A0ABP9TPH8_9MICC